MGEATRHRRNTSILRAFLWNGSSSFWGRGLGATDIQLVQGASEVLANITGLLESS